ncbi:MAG: glycosyltransferase [Acidobacteria bacterium]|nr:glycosyltransferase [Acidobacteriota bacterium]
MRATLLTIGSRGDVEPYVALGTGLKSAGLQVCLATHASFEKMTRDAGLDFRPVAGDPRAALEAEAGQRWLETDRNTVAFLKRMVDASSPAARQILDDWWRAGRDADVILFPVLALFAALSISEKLGIPVYPAYLQHVHPTRTYPSPISVPLPFLGGAYNRLTYPVGERLCWQSMRSLIDGWREQTLGLRPYSFGGPLGGWKRRRPPYFYGFSPTVVPKAREWGDEVHITGYWLRPTPADWRPPADLVDFLAAGPAPVFVGFGSMTGRDAATTTELVVSALTRGRRRGILLGGWGGLGAGALPDDVFQLDWAPFEWLFPRMSAVVHHGGAGTTAAGLRAGIPNVVVPFFGDQHFWAWRIQDLGAGPKPIPHSRLNAERLADALRRSLGDDEMRSRAARVGERIRREDGVAAAVAAICRTLH